MYCLYVLCSVPLSGTALLSFLPRARTALPPVPMTWSSPPSEPWPSVSSHPGVRAPHGGHGQWRCGSAVWGRERSAACRRVESLCCTPETSVNRGSVTTQSKTKQNTCLGRSRCLAPGVKLSFSARLGRAKFMHRSHGKDSGATEQICCCLAKMRILCFSLCKYIPCNRICHEAFYYTFLSKI